MAAGIGFVPEDRRQQGLVMDMSVQQNVALASLRNLEKGGLIRASAERAMAIDWAARLKIKYGRLTDPVSMLSGGNQQKVVLAKWLGRKPSLLIVDEPTRGIDVGTKAEVHHLLTDLARSGVGILMISSELPEVLGVSDRILVMREGVPGGRVQPRRRLGGGRHVRRHGPARPGERGRPRRTRRRARRQNGASR